MIEPSQVFKFEVLKGDSEQESVLLWKVEADLPYFDGHFPGNPVLPAIALIDAAVSAIIVKTQMNWGLRNVKSAKFADIIQPGTTLELKLHRKNDTDWDVKYFKPGEKTEAIVKLEIQLRTLDSGVSREIMV